jgi:type IV pilus assembly protein PilV
MLNATRFPDRRHRGTTILEVLVTMLILAFGLLGLAGLQMKIHTAETESYQRAQAILLLSDMAERIKLNRLTPQTYVTGTTSPLGVGDTQPAPAACSALPIGGTPDQLRLRDWCEWSNALKGASEQAGGQSVGTMIGGRGCIEQLQAANPATGVCTPGVYRVTVTWQGLNPTVAPALTCGAGLYGAPNLQRAVSANVTVGLPQCTMS